MVEEMIPLANILNKITEAHAIRKWKHVLWMVEHRWQSLISTFTSRGDHTTSTPKS